MVRCVVTGEREDGTSVVVADDTLEFAPIALVPPSTAFYRLWGDDAAPRLPTDGTPPDQATYFPPAGGYRFMVITLAPESEQAGPVADLDAAMAEFHAAMPGFSEWVDADEPGMHRTDTVDFDVILSGEVWLELDDGVEVHLHAGDCVVQNGTRHAWRNRSQEPCTFVAAVVGARRERRNGVRRHSTSRGIEMFELMASVSVVVDAIDPAAETLQRAIGVLEPRPQAYRGGAGIAALFCRVHPKYAVAPTFLELVTSAPGEGTAERPAFPVAAIAAAQGDRPVKLHATGLALPYPALVELAAHLEAVGVPYWYLGSGPTARLVVGAAASTEPHNWGSDAGLFVEAIPSAELLLAEDAFTAPADVPADLPPDAMVRIVAREHLVDDLDETLGILAANLQWTPSSIVEEVGCRRAVMPFSVARSARVELVQPTGPGVEAERYERLGPGASTVRIAVVDVDAKAADLAERGTSFTLTDGVLRPDPDATLFVPFEFVTATR